MPIKHMLHASAQAVTELPASASLPEVEAELGLVGAHAYRWIYCWVQVHYICV